MKYFRNVDDKIIEKSWLLVFNKFSLTLIFYETLPMDRGKQ